MTRLSDVASRRPWLVALAALAVAVPAFAGDEPPAAAAEPSAPAVAADAVVVRWNPIRQEMEAPAAAARAELMRQLHEVLAAQLTERGAIPPADAPRTKALPGGGVALRVPLTQLETSVVRVGPDGQLLHSCVDGLAEAARLAAEAPVTPAAGPAEK